jgi:hypothetical protein
MVRGEPLHLVGIALSDVDPLVTEFKESPRRLAAAGIEHLDIHAENLAVPRSTCRDVADIDDEMIQGMNLDRHVSSFRRDVPRALSALGKLCYNRGDAAFKPSDLQEQHWENP